MTKERTIDLLKSLFEDNLVEILLKEGRIEEIEANELLIDIGDPIDEIPLILSGSVKVLIEDSERGELLLYYLEGGHTCSVTLDCCDGRRPSRVRAITETPSEILFLSKSMMSELMSIFPSWNRFVLKSYNARLDDLLGSVDALAFDDLSERLRTYLSEKARLNESARINTTHAEIARDLNTSRVVVSRLVKNFELKGQLRQFRGGLELLEEVITDSKV